MTGPFFDRFLYLSLTSISGRVPLPLLHGVLMMDVAALHPHDVVIALLVGVALGLLPVAETILQERMIAV